MRGKLCKPCSAILASVTKVMNNVPSIWKFDDVALSPDFNEEHEYIFDDHGYVDVMSVEL